MSGIFRTLTGERYTIRDSSTEIPNGRDTVESAGSYSANEPSRGDGTPGGNIALSDVPFSGKINGAEEPTSITMDFSLRYRIPFGSRGGYATLSLDAFNLFDRVNFSNVGNTDSSNSAFLIPTQAFPMRVIQGGVKFTY